MRQDIETDFGKGFPEKAPRMPAGTKAAPKSAEPAKKKGGGKGAAAIVVLIALTGICYYYNILDLKTKVVGFFITQDSQYAQAMAGQQTAAEQIGQRQAELDGRRDELDRREKELADREAAVDYKEDEAADAQAAADAKQANLEKMANIYGSMDHAAAAGILGKFTDRQWVADLLSRMSEKKAAAILAAMDAKLAAEITMKMAPG